MADNQKYDKHKSATYTPRVICQRCGVITGQWRSLLKTKFKLKFPLIHLTVEIHYYCKKNHYVYNKFLFKKRKKDRRPIKLMYWLSEDENVFSFMLFPMPTSYHTLLLAFKNTIIIKRRHSLRASRLKVRSVAVA